MWGRRPVGLLDEDSSLERALSGRASSVILGDLGPERGLLRHGTVGRIRSRRMTDLSPPKGPGSGTPLACSDS